MKTIKLYLGTLNDTLMLRNLQLKDQNEAYVQLKSIFGRETRISVLFGNGTDQAKGFECWDYEIPGETCIYSNGRGIGNIRALERVRDIVTG